jgi:hypothetical protein
VSGGVSLPRFTVTARQRPNVAVAAQGRPVVASVVVRGQQGARGETGLQGPPGVSLGFGDIIYTDRTSGPEDRFEANVRQQVRFSGATTTVMDKLLPPFVGHQFLVNDRLMARALNDVYHIRINLIVSADAASTRLKMDCDAQSAFGPLQADDSTLFSSAGVPERVTFSFAIQVQGNTLANGAAFYLTSTQPVTVLSETLFIIPATVQPETV